MNQGDAVDRLLTAFPEQAAWPRMRGETYGPRDIQRDAPVRRVLFAVTCTPVVENAYAQRNYDLLVLHHPMRPRAPLPHVVLHTPLDCAMGGLNDLWRDALGIQDARHITENLGWYGTVAPMSAQEFRDQVREITGGIDGQLLLRTPSVSSIAVCAGLGGWIAAEAAATGADAFVTGELTQPATDLACPVVIEVGHTRSERIGAEAIRRILGPEIQVDAAPLTLDRFANEVFSPRRRREE